MRNRLIMVSTLLLASVAADAAVIDFNSADDLSNFNQTTANFWAVSSGVGLGDPATAALTGANTGEPAWMTYTAGFDPNATSVSAGIYFKLGAGSAVSSGYALILGVSSSTNYTPNVSTVEDDSKNHYSVALHYNSQSPRQFRVMAQNSIDGVYTINTSSYNNITNDSWYYLSMETTLDVTTSIYSVNAKLYSSDSAGVLGTTPIMTTSLGNFAIADLTDASKNYFFFGMDGRAATRGVLALDNFTYAVVPEPSTAGLVLLSGFGVLAARRFLKK